MNIVKQEDENRRERKREERRTDDECRYQQQQAQQQTNAILQHLLNISKPTFPTSKTTKNVLPHNLILTTSSTNASPVVNSKLNNI